MPRYVLIDAANGKDTPRALHFYTEGFRARSLFTNKPERALADAGPWLAELDGNRGLNNWLGALDMREGVLTWLTASAGFEEVFRHLEKCLGNV